MSVRLSALRSLKHSLEQHYSVDIYKRFIMRYFFFKRLINRGLILKAYNIYVYLIFFSSRRYIRILIFYFLSRHRILCHYFLTI